MSPMNPKNTTKYTRFPRLRGDEPSVTRLRDTQAKFSPPTRG